MGINLPDSEAPVSLPCWLVSGGPFFLGLREGMGSHHEMSVVLVLSFRCF